MAVATEDTLVKAVRALSSVCDFATTEDGQGFNGSDAIFGHRLAALDERQWTPANRAAAYEMLRKYKRQLAGLGVDYEAIEAPELNEAEVASRRTKREGEAWSVVFEAGEYVVRFPYDDAMVAAIRDVPGRRYSDKANHVPKASGAALARFIETFERDWEIDRLAQALLEEAKSAPAQAPPRGTVDIEDGKLIVAFPYDRELIDGMRTIATRRFDGARKANVIDIAGAQDLAFFLERFEGFAVSEEAAQVLAQASAYAENIAAQRAEMVSLSRAADADVEIPPLGGELRPFQRAGVAYAVRAGGRTFIGDDMGTGKTVQALAAAKVLDAFPLIVVCPASVKLSWRNHVIGPVPGAPSGWLPGTPTVVLDGRKANPAKLVGAEVVVLNWDILAAWRETLEAIAPRGLIFDESHYAKNRTAGRTHAALDLRKVIPKDGMVLNTSGTAVMNRPKELIAQLQLIDRLQEFGGASNFRKRYCDSFFDGYRWNDSGASNVEELSRRLREVCYIRRTKAEVMSELPPKQYAPVEAPLSNRRDYERAERETIKFLEESVARDAEIQAEIAALPAGQRAERLREIQSEKAERARSAEKLVKLNLLRKVCGEGKIKGAVDWVQNFLESGDSKLIVFAHHISVQKALLASMPGAARIFGEDSSPKRTAAIERFQTDPECRLIVCSLQAAREGITLTAASDVLTIELGWTPSGHDQAEDRAHRMGQSDSVTCWYLLAEETIDGDMHELIEAKREVVTGIQDGKAVRRDTSIQSDLEARLLAKGAR